MQDGINYQFIRRLFEGKEKPYFNFNIEKNFLVETDNNGIEWYFYKGRKLTKEQFDSIYNQNK